MLRLSEIGHMHRNDSVPASLSKLGLVQSRDTLLYLEWVEFLLSFGIRVRDKL